MESGQRSISTAPTAEGLKSDQKRARELFELKFIDHKKGYGVISTDYIKAGTEIMLEQIALIIGFSSRKCRLRQENSNKQIAEEVRAMGKDFAHSFLKLPSWNREHLGVFDAIVTASHIPVNINGTIKGAAIGLNSAYLNHACIPNSHASVVELQVAEGDMLDRQFWISVRACVDIMEGCEITVSYQSVSMPLELRKLELGNAFGFECACNHCETPDLGIEEFMGVLLEFDRAVYNPAVIDSQPAQALQAAYRIANGMIKARMCDVRFPVLWEHCAVICSWHSDLGRTMMFLRKAQADFKRVEGPAGQNYLRMKLWYDRPELMPAHEVSRLGLSGRDEMELLLMNPRYEAFILFMLSAEGDQYIRLCYYHDMADQGDDRIHLAYTQDSSTTNQNPALPLSKEELDKLIADLKDEKRDIDETRLRGGKHEKQRKKDCKGKGRATN